MKVRLYFWLPLALAMFAGSSHPADAAIAPNCHSISNAALNTTFTTSTTSQGTITRGGLINGSTQFSVTSNNGTGGYTGVFRDTTQSGTLVTNDSGQFNVDGSFTEDGVVDGSQSTGLFNGATGTIHFAGTVTSFQPLMFEAQVTAMVCIANG
jgi:hypothetical protein